MDLTALAAFCGSKALAVGGVLGTGASLPAVLFLVGLTGSAVHCGPMCGPFVLAQVSDRLAAVPATRLCEATRVTSALLVPYHLGRLTTYAGLGAVGAGAGALLASLPWFDSLSAMLLLAAALMFVLQSLKRVLPLASGPLPWVAFLGRKAARIDRTRRRGGFLLGLLLGFLPCGLLYGALAAASAGGHAGLGALAMLGFGLGTVPSLVIVGVMGHLAGARWRSLQATLSPILMLISALTLAGMGLARLAA